MMNMKIPRVIDFPKTSDIKYQKLFDHKTLIRVYREKDAGNEYALLEIILTADRGTTVVRLQPDVQYVVRDGDIYIKCHPKDIADNFNLVPLEYQMAWVTEETFLKFIEANRSPYLRPTK